MFSDMMGNVYSTEELNTKISLIIAALQLKGIITEEERKELFGEETIKMDFNHPLAGETLHFTGEVLDVHEPTAEELAKLLAPAGGCGCGSGEGGGCGSGGCGCGSGEDKAEGGCGSGCGCH